MYQSILVHACQTAQAQSRYRLAGALARAGNAQVTGVALSGATEFIYRCGAAAAMMPIGPDDFSFLTETAQRDMAAFDEAMRTSGVHAFPGKVSDDSAGSALPLLGRFCDLLVIGQSTSPDAVIADDYTLARTVLVHAPCPVMVVPSASTVESVPVRPLIAWDGSMEASRAVRAALPLLRRAGGVTAVSFQPLKYRDEGGDPGRQLAAYLACHGIDASVIGPAASDSIGHALLELAKAHDHDLIVMGAYGHSRFREIVLGGVTEVVLASATVPLLMSN